jgi:Transposase DDE domain
VSEFHGVIRKTIGNQDSGIESTNSLLKRVTGLGRLRVRGRSSVFMTIYLKVAGWNVLRAAAVRSVIEKLTKPGQTALCAQQWTCILSLLSAFRSIAAA